MFFYSLTQRLALMTGLRFKNRQLNVKSKRVADSFKKRENAVQSISVVSGFIVKKFQLCTLPRHFYGVFLPISIQIAIMRIERMIMATKL